MSMKTMMMMLVVMLWMQLVLIVCMATNGSDRGVEAAATTAAPKAPEPTTIPYHTATLVKNVGAGGQSQIFQSTGIGGGVPDPRIEGFCVIAQICINGRIVRDDSRQIHPLWMKYNSQYRNKWTHTFPAQTPRPPTPGPYDVAVFLTDGPPDSNHDCSWLNELDMCVTTPGSGQLPSCGIPMRRNLKQQDLLEWNQVGVLNEHVGGSAVIPQPQPAGIKGITKVCLLQQACRAGCQPTCEMGNDDWRDRCETIDVLPYEPGKSLGGHSFSNAAYFMQIAFLQAPARNGDDCEWMRGRNWCKGDLDAPKWNGGGGGRPRPPTPGSNPWPHLPHQHRTVSQNPHTQVPPPPPPQGPQPLQVTVIVSIAMTSLSLIVVFWQHLKFNSSYAGFPRSARSLRLPYPQLTSFSRPRHPPQSWRCCGCGYGWISAVIHTSNRDVEKTAGLDASVTVRVMRDIAMMMSLITIIAAGVLLPINYSAQGDDYTLYTCFTIEKLPSGGGGGGGVASCPPRNLTATIVPLQGLSRLSIANLPLDSHGNRLFYWHVFILYIVTMCVLATLTHLYSWYIEQRQRYFHRQYIQRLQRYRRGTRQKNRKVDVDVDVDVDPGVNVVGGVGDESSSLVIRDIGVDVTHSARSLSTFINAAFQPYDCGVVDGRNDADVIGRGDAVNASDGNGDDVVDVDVDADADADADYIPGGQPTTAVVYRAHDFTTLTQAIHKRDVAAGRLCEVKELWLRSVKDARLYRHLRTNGCKATGNDNDDGDNVDDIDVVNATDADAIALRPQHRPTWCGAKVDSIAYYTRRHRDAVAKVENEVLAAIQPQPRPCQTLIVTLQASNVDTDVPARILWGGSNQGEQQRRQGQRQRQPSVEDDGQRRNSQPLEQQCESVDSDREDGNDNDNDNGNGNGNGNVNNDTVDDKPNSVRKHTNVNRNKNRRVPTKQQIVQALNGSSRKNTTITVPSSSSSSSSTPITLSMAKAGDPRDIIWSSFTITLHQRRLRQRLSVALLVMIALVWIIPTTLLAGLVSSSTLASRWHWLRFIHTWPAFLSGMITGLLPAYIALICNRYLKQLLRRRTRWLACASHQEEERRFIGAVYPIFLWNAFGAFLVAVALLQLIQASQEAGDLHTKDLLHNWLLPVVSSFFVHFTVASAFTASPLQYIDITSAMYDCCCRARVRRLRRRQRRRLLRLRRRERKNDEDAATPIVQNDSGSDYGAVAVIGGDNILDDDDHNNHNSNNDADDDDDDGLSVWRAPTIQYGSFWSSPLLLFTTAMSMAVVQPIILPFASFFFIIEWFITKYRAVYVVVPDVEGAGQYFSSWLFGYFCFTMAFAQCIVIGLACLREAWIAVGILCPLPIISLIYYVWMTHRYHLAAQQLLQPVRMDGKNDSNDRDDGKDVDAANGTNAGGDSGVVKSSGNDLHQRLLSDSSVSGAMDVVNDSIVNDVNYVNTNGGDDHVDDLDFIVDDTLFGSRSASHYRQREWDVIRSVLRMRRQRRQRRQRQMEKQRESLGNGGVNGDGNVNVDIVKEN